MSIATSLSRLFASASSVYRGLPSPVVPAALPDPNSAVTTYRVMRALYDNNGLYEELMSTLRTQSIWTEARLPLRNPANRVAEFYAVKLWPGADLSEALPIVSDVANADSLKAAITAVWNWSNWAAQKQVAARWLAIYGDLFIQVVGRPPRQGIANDPPRVYFNLLEPETVTAIDTDERGFLTYLRLDVPKIRRVGDKEEAYTRTEVWDKATGIQRAWEHTKGARADLTQLGAPVLNVGILAEYGIDFIPVVHAKFRDVGDQRGVSAYMHAFDKIMDVDRSATRLHQMLFRHNNVTWALHGHGKDVAGRPMPGPAVGDGSTITLGEERFLNLPGTSQLSPLVPNLNYEAQLHVLQDDLAELERDLPELAYYRLRDLGGDLSGRAVRMLLGDAIDRVQEARGNAEAALIRADQMALTIAGLLGAFSGIPDIGTLGTFEDGALEHHFDKRDVIPSNGLEDAQTEQAEVAAKIAKLELGVSKLQALIELGYDEVEAADMLAQSQAESQAGAEQFLTQMARGNVPVDSQTATTQMATAMDQALNGAANGQRRN